MNTQKPVIFLAFANHHVKPANYLRNLPEERRGIRQVLQQAQKKNLCDVVERANATIDEILDVFQDETYKNRIAVFHYGGHANNYGLLLDSFQRGRMPAHKDGLENFLARQNALKLIFLNGCSTQQHALQLKQAGIPAVIGTSQEINDQVAARLAIRFYNGIATGSALEKAWRDAEDEIKTTKGANNFQAMFRYDKKEPGDRFPWDIYFKEGAENIKNWNLPDAAGNPLFGLPPLPRSHALPETPFLFLNRYERKHAELFFGRSQYIRELYQRVTDRTYSPIILFHGQSGAGKSSLLESGLIPRIEQSCTVEYAGRNREKGLLGTLEDVLRKQFNRMPQAPAGNGLDNIDNNAINDIDNLEGPAIPELWKQIESRTRKPLVVILDQAEEVFTRPNERQPREFESFTGALSPLFTHPASYPSGKLILAYRKEYHPEIDQQFKTKHMERTGVFLQPLNRQGIIEVVTGITLNPRLKEKYGLEVEENLPEEISNDLLKDNTSPIAPTLQILLTKMWDRTKTPEKDDVSNRRKFTIKQYRDLRREGLLMRDFFNRQMEKLEAWQKEIYDSGIALDVLKFHTTQWGTACSRSIEEIKEEYPHSLNTIDDLLKKLKDLYQLSDTRQNKNETSLAHDILAPVVIERYNDSDRPGQRAARILAARIEDFKKNPHDVWLNKTDLKIVEEGKRGTRALNRQEIRLLEKSNQRLKRAKMKKVAGLVSLLVITILAISVAWKWKLASDREQAVRQTKVNTLVYQAQLKEKEDPTIALRLLEAARKLDNSHIIKGIMNNIYRGNSFYKTLFRQGSAVTAMAVLPESRRILTAAPDGKIRLWRLWDGRLIKSFTFKGREISCAAFSTDGRYVAAGFGDQTVRLWDMKDNKQRVFKGHKGSITAVAFSPDNKRILTGSMDNSVRLWDIKGKELRHLGKYKGNPYCTAFSPDGRYVLLGMDRGVILLCTSRGEEKLEFIGHRKRVNSVAFSPCGNYLLTASADKTARLWDRKGNQIHVFKGHESCINCANFSPDGCFVLTGSSDKTVRTWKLEKTMDLDDFLAKGICQHLSKEQKRLYGIGKNSK